MRKAIGYDIDNVLKPTFQVGLSVINKTYGTDYKLEDCTHQTFEESFGMNEDEINELFRQASSNGLLSKLMPIKGARRVINRYHDHLDQYFITARDKSMREETLDWFCRRSFRHIPDRVILGSNTPHKKASLAKSLGLGLFVEDNLQNANAIAAEASIPVLLVDFGYPFNRNRDYHRLVKLVYSWKEIDQEIKGILNPF